jgi:hypothetical protein
MILIFVGFLHLWSLVADDIRRHQLNKNEDEIAFAGAPGVFNNLLLYLFSSQRLLFYFFVRRPKLNVVRRIYQGMLLANHIRKAESGCSTDLLKFMCHIHSLPVRSPFIPQCEQPGPKLCVQLDDLSLRVFEKWWCLVVRIRYLESMLFRLCGDHYGWCWYYL